MLTIQLSAATLAICREHWNPPRTRCSACPITHACHAPVHPLTYDSCDRHAEVINAAAIKASP